MVFTVQCIATYLLQIHYNYIYKQITNNYIYYPTLIHRVQIMRETSANIHDICIRLIPPTVRKNKNLSKSEFWGNENVG